MLTHPVPEAAQAPTLRCLGCKHANPAHSNFCNICGRGLPSVPCPQCGEMNDLAMATMCTRCGGPLTDRADSEAAKDARLRVIEAAMGGGFPPVMVPRVNAEPPSSSSTVDVDLNAVAELPPPAVAAAWASGPAPAARPAAPPIPAIIPTLTAAIPAPALSSSPSSNPYTFPSPLASGGPPAPSLARMPRSGEPPALGAANPASGSASAQPSLTLADFGPSSFNLPHLDAGRSANSAPFVLTGWRTDEPQHADFDMRQITELVRTSLAAETVPMLPVLSSGGATAHGEPEPPPGHVAPRPRRLAMAGGVAAAVVVAVFAYRVYGPARLPELTPVPLAGGGAATTATATSTTAVDRKAAQMQANLDRAAELLAQKPTGAGAGAGGATAGEPAGDVGSAAYTPPPPAAATTPSAAVTAGVAAAALAVAAPTVPSPLATILPTKLAPAPPPTSARQNTSRSPRPATSRETAANAAAARAARSSAIRDSARPYGPPLAYRAQPAPAATPCTAGVAALGLCDTVTSPTTPRR